MNAFHNFMEISFCFFFIHLVRQVVVIIENDTINDIICNVLTFETIRRKNAYRLKLCL